MISYIHYVKIKVQFTLEEAMKAQRGSRGTLYSFFNLGTRWGGWSTPRPRLFNPGKRPSTHCRRLGGPQGRSGRVRKILPPPGFNPRTVTYIMYILIK
jgi:hypothetical protein